MITFFTSIPVTLTICKLLELGSMYDSVSWFAIACIASVMCMIQEILRGWREV